MNSLKQELLRLEEQIKKHQNLLSDPDLAPLVREEISKLQAQKKSLEESLSLTESHKKNSTQKQSLNRHDSANAILEIRSAAGGDEAKIWATNLKRMYLRFADTNGFKIQELDDSTIKITAKGAFGLFRFEAGVHRVQRVPQTEKQGRIHTSTASVAVLPEIPESEITVKPEELEWQFTRAGGHGGQNVNKVNSAVRLTYKPTGLVISVRQERKQQQNKAIALEILRSKLWEQNEEKRLKTIDITRKSAVGRGMRAEKIRTYNFPQNRVTDHRLNKSWHNLDTILDGNFRDSKIP